MMPGRQGGRRKRPVTFRRGHRHAARRGVRVMHGAAVLHLISLRETLHCFLAMTEGKHRGQGRKNSAPPGS
jgi:hypothetical protein